SVLYIMRTADRTRLPDTIPYTTSVSLAWLPDNSGFYYTRFPEPGTVPPGDERYHRWVYLHRLGDDWRADSLIFGSELDKAAWPGVGLSPDGRRLLVAVYRGWSDIDTYVRDRTDPASSFTRLYDDVEATVNVTPLDDCFLAFTNLNAPRFRLMRGQYEKPGIENWVEIIPEREAILESAAPVGGRLVTRSLQNAYSVVEVFTMEGRLLRTLPTPSPGTVYSVSGELDGRELFYYFSSFDTPSAIYRYDFAADTVALWAQLDAGVDLSNLVVKQVWYKSHDGTPVSMFLVHREGIPLDGSNPAFLYGYGGFNVTMTPYFSRTLAVWYDQGGIYALPNIRGGGEYGEAWHDAGKLGNKQNSFDDFIAAAEYLIAEGYTSPARLCISGGSNGGLLTGAVLVQRPDLFRAAIVAVPLLDMIRYHRFLAARIWVPEYGSSEDPEQFAYLLAYSPYHHVTESADYPAVLLTAGLSDSRVDPMHARKMTARLQAADATPETPVLLRIEPKAGHGQGKPISKQIEEQTDQWSFVFRALNVRMK
ncbi:MAG TPA: prolyl oligopeptidase family serine peptidase, partial [candidate division Zixibacteria bacterium]|nr:prolyl oligopeptidase family serine peptidase [candidate division Zixibacteria bacterium]